MNKTFFKTTIKLVIICIGFFVVYVSAGTRLHKSLVEDYLLTQGYSETDIHLVNVLCKMSNEWQLSVILNEDHQKTYYYSINNGEVVLDRILFN